MGLWMIRGGGHGQYEQKFLDDSRVYLTWSGLEHDLSAVKDRAGIREIIEKFYPGFTKAHISNNTGQIWGFSHGMQKEDWILMPRKNRGSIAISELLGDYEFHAKGPNPFFHSRKVKWIEQGIPRTNFDKDILFSLNAAMTICRIQRNSAEERVRGMQREGWAGVPHIARLDDDEDDGIELGSLADPEVAARDAIAKHVLAKFKGRDMESLVEAILKAQGYTTFRSDEGADKGVDLLAAPGPLGFGEPRMCVQVKSAQTPVDRPTLDQLIGTMQNVHAEQGLLVSWGGFKPTVLKEKATQFFRVRLWDQNDLINQILEHYDRLDEDIKAEIPLKRIWALALPDETD